MRFHGFMLIRDEEDILPQTLPHILSWCDSVYIYDLGSTDQTWDIVQDLAAKDKRIVPFLRRPTVYGEGLRCVMFDKYRSKMDDGDWFIKLDADEFYEISPPQFVKQRLRPYESRVDLMWYFFRLTNHDVAAYKSDAEILADRRRPIQLRRRFYKTVSHAEPRMFRYRSTMRWHPSNAWPFNMGIIAKERLPIRHYPHRDPIQMERRHRLRAGIMRLGAGAPPHWKLEDWRKDVLDVEQDAANRGAALSEEGVDSEVGHNDGELREWAPGTTLPPATFLNHMEPWRQRLVKRIMYRTIVRWTDLRRPAYPPDFQPTYIDESINQTLCLAEP